MMNGAGYKMFCISLNFRYVCPTRLDKMGRVHM